MFLRVRYFKVVHLDHFTYVEIVETRTKINLFKFKIFMYLLYLNHLVFKSIKFSFECAVSRHVGTLLTKVMSKNKDKSANSTFE